MTKWQAKWYLLGYMTDEWFRINNDPMTAEEYDRLFTVAQLQVELYILEGENKIQEPALHDITRHVLGQFTITQ